MESQAMIFIISLEAITLYAHQTYLLYLPVFFFQLIISKIA